ncbi:MAG: ferredoxin-type protein NapF [Colwellia sp.]|nr:ferredoxin-type protein NapF [Colwellia sp.]
MVDLARRNFFRGKKASTPAAIRLPWVINEQLFIDNCTQCGDCITHCAENIIVKGDGGFPKIDFSKGECSFCQQCLEVCQQPLFVNETAEIQAAWQLDIKIKSNCLAMNQIVCQSCQDCCEPEAISFKYLTSKTPQPQIELDKCNGCGACVSVCPQSAIELTPKLAPELITKFS